MSHTIMIYRSNHNYILVDFISQYWCFSVCVCIFFLTNFEYSFEQTFEFTFCLKMSAGLFLFIKILLWHNL